MSMQRKIDRSSGTRVKRALGVQAALEWAFRMEKAQLELPARRHVHDEGFSFGLEYVLMQRATLGNKVDGGQRKTGSYTHADAELIAATMAGMPDSLGGIRMAVRVAELARAGMPPTGFPVSFRAVCGWRPRATSMASGRAPYSSAPNAY